MRGVFSDAYLVLACAFLVVTTLGQGSEDEQLEQPESRSIKTSLDKVIGEVKSRLEAVFASSKRALGTRKRAGSRLIETPIETVLPESWLVEEDNNFFFPDMPTDVEPVQVDDRTDALEGRQLRSKQKKHRKHKKRKKKHSKFNQKRLKGSKDQFRQNSVMPEESPGPKVYHKYLEEYHAGRTTDNPNNEFENEIEQYSGGHKIVISLAGSGSKRGNETESSDDIQTYLFPELMKENETEFAIFNDLTNQDTKSSSVLINEIDIFHNRLEYAEDIAQIDSNIRPIEELADNMVRLEIAMIDSVSSPRNIEMSKVALDQNSTIDAFLPFVTNIETIANNMLYEDIESDDIKFDKSEVENKFVKEEGFLEGENVLDSTSTKVVFTIKNEPWVFPILIMASTAICLLLSFEVMVVFKCMQPVPGHGHPVVGHTLLLGLLLCSAISLVYTLTSTEFTCAIVRFGSGLSYATVYSALLVKFVFLTFLRSGFYLPPLYQGFLLFLALLIQVVIGVQWLVAVPPGVTTSLGGVLCGTTFEQQLHGHVYNILIVAFLVCLNIRFSLVRTKYKEAGYIGLVALSSGPLWVGWVLAGLSVPVNYQDLCSASGLLVTSLGTFAVMLLAKGVEKPLRKVDSNRGTIYRMQDHKSLTTFSICPKIGSVRVFSMLGFLLPKTRALSRSSLVSVETKTQTFFQTREPGVGTLSRKLECPSTGASEEDDSSQTYSPEPGYRITNSFDRFPFMSRPLHSTLGHSRPASSLIYSVGDDTHVKQSLSNPNVLFCTPEDMKVLRYDKFR